MFLGTDGSPVTLQVCRRSCLTLSEAPSLCWSMRPDPESGANIKAAACGQHQDRVSRSGVRVRFTSQAGVCVRGGAGLKQVILLQTCLRSQATLVRRKS